MKNKIITAIVTVPFVETFLTLLHKSDRVTDFIPFFHTIQGGRLHVSAYDFFIMLSAFALIVFYRYLHATPKACLQEIQKMLSGVQAFEIALCAGVVVAMHMFAWPYIHDFFSEPLAVLRDAHYTIRHTVMVIMPFLWLLIVYVVNNYMPSAPFQSIPSNQQGMQMPSPPQGLYGGYQP